jgi:hypothetical protein
MDPTAALTDELMVHIFSFVGGQLAKKSREARDGFGLDSQKTEEQGAFEYVEEEVTDEEEEKIRKKNKKVSENEEESYLDVAEAGRFYYTLARVNRSWKTIMDAAISRLATYIILTYDEKLELAKVDGCFRWLIAHKMNIGSMSAKNCTYYQDNGHNHPIRPSIIDIIRACDTKDLKDFTFIVYHGESPAGHLQARHFLDEIAKECPNLTSVNMTLVMRPMGGLYSTDPTLVSPAFFSLSSLRTLHLGIDMREPTQLGSSLIATFVEGLPNLEYLFLNSGQHATLGGDSAHTVFPIRSQSLKQILAEDFTKHIKFSLDCPQLQFYRCRGFVAHTPQPGQLPQRIALQQHVVEAHNTPQSCYALVIHVCNPLGPPIGFPFHGLLGPTATLLPLRHHHHR